MTVCHLFFATDVVDLLQHILRSDLHGKPVQFREVQGYESPRFLSYFRCFICLQGGVATGFQHISDPLPLDIRKLYRVNLSKAPGGRPNLVVREVPALADSLVAGDVYVLDKGANILQFNTKTSAGQERFKAAEFVQSLENDRKSQTEVTVYGKRQDLLHRLPNLTIDFPQMRVAQEQEYFCMNSAKKRHFDQLILPQATSQKYIRSCIAFLMLQEMSCSRK